MRARSLLPAALIALALAGGACTGEPSPSSSTSAAPSESPIPEGPVRFVPGEYRVEISNVTVALTWNGGTGEMTVENGSTQELGEPSVTALTNEPVQVESTVEGAPSIAVGETQSYEVKFPDSLAPSDAGLLLLHFGEDSWGAFSPVVAES